MSINPYKISGKTFKGKPIDKTQIICYTIYTAKGNKGEQKNKKRQNANNTINNKR